MSSSPGSIGGLEVPQFSSVLARLSHATGWKETYVTELLEKGRVRTDVPKLLITFENQSLFMGETTQFGEMLSPAAQ